MKADGDSGSIKETGGGAGGSRAEDGDEDEDVSMGIVEDGYGQE